MANKKKETRYILNLLGKYKKIIIINTVLSVILMGSYMLLPVLEQQIIDEGLISKKYSYLIELIILMALISILAYSIEYIQMHIQAGMAASLRNSLKLKALSHALKIKINLLKKHSLLALMTDANTDINNMSRICSNDIFGILVEFITIVGYLIGLFFLSWKLTIIVLCLIPIKLFISTKTGKKSNDKMEELLNLQKKISRWQSDNYPGIIEIKNWNLYKHIEEEFAELSVEREKLDKQMYIFSALDSYLKRSVEKLVFIIVYIFGAFQIWNNQLSIGTFIAFIQFSEYLLTPVDVLSSLKIVLGNVLPSVKSFNNFMGMDEEDFKEKQTEMIIPKEIKFENISFSYGETKVFDNFNLTLRKGEKVAIIGLNGSGKSTLIQLLMRYYLPTQGKILFDDININDFSLDRYREEISIMEQNVFLFNTSIINNIYMFSNDEKGDFDREILQYVEKLPEKEYTKVGFDGSKLSGGEKQRLALARSFMKKSEILILDEATSNCDVGLERVYIDILDNLKRSYIICISHNFDLIKKFDRIVILQDGKVVEDGSYEELKYQLQGLNVLHEGKTKRLKRKGDRDNVNYI